MLYIFDYINLMSAFAPNVKFESLFFENSDEICDGQNKTKSLVEKQYKMVPSATAWWIVDLSVTRCDGRPSAYTVHLNQKKIIVDS